MQHPQLADIFLVPLINGDFAVGQVANTKDTPDGTVLCIFTLLKSAPDWPPSAIHYSEAIALVLTSDKPLLDGTWQIVGFEAVPPLERIFDLSKALRNKFSDVAVQDPAIMEAFVNACHGLYPWDGFPDPQFFNNLLIAPDRVPSAARMKSQFDQ